MNLLPLSRATVAKVFPAQTLSDLIDEPHDFENDFHVLLDYLQPYYDPQPVAEPLPRVRAAARRCLKDPGHHGDFVQLFLNTVRGQFHIQFRDLCLSAPLGQVAMQVLRLREYYARKTAVLSLSVLASEQLQRGINGFFLQYLHTPRLLAELENLAAHTLSKVGSVKAAASDWVPPLAPAAGGPPRSITTFKILATVGMSETIQNIVVRHATGKLLSYVHEQCAGVWDRDFLAHIQNWVNESLAPVFEMACSTRGHFTEELVSIARDELILLRIGEIFSMVKAFPRLEPSLLELHRCLAQAQNPLHRSRLVELFVGLCQRFLLNSASNTVEIILVYTKTLKAFLLVDPTGVLLDKVARPMRKYLKSRPDLVSQLVRAMLDRNPQTNRLVELAEAVFTLSNQNLPFVDDLSDRDWCPDPIDALPDFRKRTVLDVVQALTSILPLASVFVDEFTTLFGDRLLQSDKYTPASILEYVHHLKARFGDGEFATLDVMIRDIEQSLKFNETLRSMAFFAPNSVPLTMSVLSKMYWPSVHDTLSENDFFPVPVEAEFAAYSKKYTERNKGRTLSLIPSLGTVKLEVYMHSSPKEYLVTPAQAKVIEVFDDDMDPMSLDTVSMLCSMPSYVVSQALKFWVQEGVLTQEGNRYKAAA